MSVRALAIALIVAAAAPARADRVVALAPLSTLGAENTSAAARKIAGELEQALAALPGTKVIGAAQVAAAIARAKKPQLAACEGDSTCIAELGKLVGAQIVVTGEVGGLGAAQVIYLGATDVASGSELRSTTLATGKDDSDSAAAAAVRLLEPERYRGTIHFRIDAPGASVFVNGTKVPLSATGDVVLPVGTQAIRVTHPEYRDFVRFVDVPYNRTVDLPVNLQQYPIVERSVKGLPVSRDKIVDVPPPVWRRWYVTGAAAVGLAVLTGIVWYAAEHSSPSCSGADCTCHTVGGGGC